MDHKPVNPRHPEQHFSPTHPHYAKAQSLGNEYRALKKELKVSGEQKKKHSKEISRAKLEGCCYKELVTAVKEASDKIKNVKKQLALTENSIQQLTRTEKNDQQQTAPQFFEKREVTKPLAVTVRECTDESAWENYIQSHPNATAYHSLKTCNVISATFQHSHKQLIALDEQQQVCGALPLYHLKSKLFGSFWCSVPFFNYGGPIADNDAIAKQLIQEAHKHIQGEGSSIEFRNSQPLDTALLHRQDKISMLLPLPKTTDELWHQLGSKLRAQVKKSKEHNLTARTGREALLNDYYRVFAHNMRDLGTPVYGKELFENMLKAHPNSQITVIYRHQKPVSAGFTLGWRNTLEIPWASTLRKANQYNANMLLYWEILQYAINNSYEVFDFGRSSKDASTYKFKKQWGAKEYQLHWYYWLPKNAEPPSLTTNNPKYKLAIKLWQLMPVWLSKIIGPHIVKYLP